MGIRGELFSTRLILPNRTYFFNVKENRMGDLYLNVVESKSRETGGFERQSVIVFAEDLQGFLGEFEKALKVLEKEVREQKRNGRKYREEGYGKENTRDKNPWSSDKDQDRDPGYGEKWMVVRNGDDPSD
ncbi:MAG: DUF3276 family protein [Spirochaetaceae bacterium]|jgi:hypothetical protein|nr:DUF3276 family protein [Spirochaetaceae bacterium]